MKLRNLTSHALQLMFPILVKEGEAPQMDVVHIPANMEKGYIVIEDSLWASLSKHKIKVHEFVEEDVVVAGVTLDNKPVTEKVKTATGKSKEVNLIKYLIQERQIELVEDAGSSRDDEELKMLDDLRALGFEVQDEIDSTKLRNLHARLFKTEPLKPTAPAAVTKA